MIGCKACPWTCAEYVRNAQGEQRSGWHLLEFHYQREHGQRPRNKGPFGRNTWRASTAAERCFNCDGRGCEGCEPGGTAEVWNFNELKRLEAPTPPPSEP